MTLRTSSPITRGPRFRHRALLLTTLITAGILAMASCGQPTSRVEVGAPGQAPATTTASTHPDHTDDTGGGGSGMGTVPAPMPMPGHTDPDMDGGHEDGHTDGPGFTEVPGGILLDQSEHGGHGEDPCAAPVTPEHYQAADKLIADTVAAVRKYHHLDAAKTAGYVQIAPPFGGEGAHYLNPAYMGDGQFVNPERIESLVYRGDTLEAAMYLMDTRRPTGRRCGRLPGAVAPSRQPVRRRRVSDRGVDRVGRLSQRFGEPPDPSHVARVAHPPRGRAIRRHLHLRLYRGAAATATRIMTTNVVSTSPPVRSVRRVGNQQRYPIRHHHRLGLARSVALVAASSTIAALLARATLRRRPRRQSIQPDLAKAPGPDTATDDRGGTATKADGTTGARVVPLRNIAKRFLGGAPCVPAAASGIGAATAAALTIAWLRRPAGGRRRSLPFAVVDTETTGLDHNLDRVIELAVVFADGLGNVGDTFTWRTRPEDGRHGAEHIHHISEADLATAPTFSEIAGVLARTLSGRTLVAHNAPFDTRFLAAEYHRAGQRAPAALLQPLCTLELASRLGMAPLRLSEVARALGSPQPATAHRAADDAVATAQLLAPLLDRAGIARSDELPLVDGSVARPWPKRRSRTADPFPAI